jgi:general secretion pathway protein J
MRLRPPRSHPQGFTLVELLVGLTLMALVSVILFGGMRFGLRAWETGGGRAERAMGIEMVQSLLRRQLAQAKAPGSSADQSPAVQSTPGQTKQDHTMPALVGRSDRVAFVAPAPGFDEAGGDFVFVLGGGDSGHSSLILAWTPVRPATSPSGGESTARLVDDVATIELAYYGVSDPQRPAQWWEEWDGALGLPQLVRVRLTFPPGDPRRWPDLIVRVMRASS